MDLPQTQIVSPPWVLAHDPSAWLTPRELSACNKAASPRRRLDKIAGRLALKLLLCETFDVAPLGFEIGSDGVAPTLSLWPGPEGIVVSLSHSHGLGAASWAWAREEETVGVDAQFIRPIHPRLSARALTEAERAQGADTLLLWALKEAGLKCRRQPWGRALQEITVTLADANASMGHAEISIPGERPLSAAYTRTGDWWLARAVRSR